MCDLPGEVRRAKMIEENMEMMRRWLEENERYSELEDLKTTIKVRGPNKKKRKAPFASDEAEVVWPGERRAEVRGANKKARTTLVAPDVESVVWHGEKRREVMEKIERKLQGLATAEDAPRGGFLLRHMDGERTLRFGGLHRALEDRVYARGVYHVCDEGPSSREDGKRVHQHVYHLVECLGQRKAKCGCGVRATKLKTLCKGAREVVRLVRAKGVMLMASEVLVLAPKWNLGTRVDLLCQDAEKRVVLVSIKTGACKTTHTYNTFRGGLQNIRDTEAERHQVQLAAERIMLQQSGVEVHRAFIVYAPPDGSTGHVEPSDPWLASAEGCAALDALLNAGAHRAD